MDLILVNQRQGKPYRLSLSQPRDLIRIVLIALPIIGALLLAGYYAARQAEANALEDQANVLRTQLEGQEEEIRESRRQTQEELSALGRRVGELRAHIIRLDALGSRLVQMAELDNGEFDFSQAPAQGGPESIEAGSTDITASVRDDFNSELDALAMQLADREQQLSVLEDLLLTRTLEDKVRPEGSPVMSGWISSYFGRRSDPFTGRLAHHRGVDFAGRSGSDIVAVAAGVVTYSGDRYGYGLLIEVNHGNGLLTRYGHNSVNHVNEGDKVERGQVIAQMGSTGRATGPNLHFEVIKDGRAVDPVAFIASNDD